MRLLTINFSIAILFTCFCLTNCHQSAGIGDDTDSDTVPGDSDSHPNGTDSNDDDSELSSDSTDDSDSIPLGGVQPLSFVIENQTNQPVVLRADAGLQNIIDCSNNAGSNYNLGMPWCMESCESATPEDYCMIMCEYYPGVLIIDAQTNVEINWDGYIRSIRLDNCVDGGACHYETAPDADDYIFSVMVYPDFQCAWEDSCIDGQEGITWGAEATGTGVSYSVEHALPSQEDIHLVISIP